MPLKPENTAISVPSASTVILTHLILPIGGCIAIMTIALITMNYTLKPEWNPQEQKMKHNKLNCPKCNSDQSTELATPKTYEQLAAATKYNNNATYHFQKLNGGKWENWSPYGTSHNLNTIDELRAAIILLGHVTPKTFRIIERIETTIAE